MSAIGDNISNTLGRFFPAVAKKPKMDKKDALAIRPLRNPVVKWELEDGDIVLHVPLRDDRIARMVKRLMKNVPECRKIVLDEVGAAVWELCDGKHTINDLVLAISSNYKLTRREAEASVTMFLQTLAKKNLIGLMSPGGKKSVKGNRK
jgi:hypothetical protein